MSLSKDPYQERAINCTGRNIMVSASAGAGKTRVLVERLVKRCLVDGVELNTVLAVTFTAAAAGEMKNRIAKRLQEEREKITDEEMKQYVDRQMIYLQSADITTIDSFCLTIIEKYSNVIGLDPQCFRNVLDGGHQELLQKQAFDECLKEYTEKYPKEMSELLYRLSARSEDYEVLFTTLQGIASHADNNKDPHEWYDKARDSYQNVRKLADYPEEIREHFFGELRLRYEMIRAGLKRLIPFADESEKVAAGVDAIENALQLLSHCEPWLDEMNYDMFRSSFDNYLSNRTTPADAKFKSYDNARKAMNNSENNLASVLFSTEVFFQDTNNDNAILCLLLDLAENMSQRFKELKKENACMDFSDMERFAYQILVKNNGTVAKRYRSHYKEVMVDEFQDTSILQDSILKELAAPGTIFRVGDVKQSIYRFRQAKPDLMRHIMGEEDTEQITLMYNYRSKNNIVYFCNELFGRIMNIPKSGDCYSEKDAVDVGRDVQRLKEPDPVQFILIDPPEKSEIVSEEDEEESVDSKKMKAEWISAKIQEMVQTGNYDYNDFAILVRSHKDKPIIRSVFDTCGIPYDIDTREGFFKSELCQTVLAFLRYMSNSNDEISLAAICTSPFCALSEEDLAKCRITSHSFKDAIEKHYPKLIEDLQELKDIIQRYGARVFLDELAVRHDFYANLEDSQKANFDYLYERVVQMSNPFCSLFDLKATMEASENENSSEAMSRGHDDRLVTVTTIHQSKGLQYRVVFLWSTDQNRANEKKEAVMVDDELFLGMAHLDLPHRIRRTTINRLAVEHKSNLEDLEEFTRLLYVALTRPEEKLFIVDVANKEYPYEPELSVATLNRRKGMTGLILAGLQSIPGLYSILHVSPAVPAATTALPKKYVRELPHFNWDTDYLKPAVTPSDHELTILPDLDPTPGYGKRYGTKMHEVLAELPDKVWSEADLSVYGLSEHETEQILAFAHSDLYAKALTMEIHKEMPFYTETENNRILGVMDFVAVNDNEIILLDYKTDKASVTEIANRYSDQLKSYAQALNVIYPNRTIHSYIWSLHNNQAKELDFNTGDAQ